MAGELARWGCDCYLIDLPGHGDSTEQFSFQAASSATDEAVGDLLPKGTDPKSDSASLVVIGHSFGARVALGSVRHHPEIAAVIALSPAAEFVAQIANVPLLIVTGEFDFPFVRRGAQFLYEQATGIRLARVEEPGRWETSTSSTRLIVLPWTDHSQTLFKPGSLREIKLWLAKINPAISEAPFSPEHYMRRLVFGLLHCGLSLLIWFPLAALVADIVMPEKSVPSGFAFTGPSENGFKLVLPYAFGASLATALLLWVNPWSRLGLMGGDYLSGFLFATGVLGFMGVRHKWELPADTWRALLCSVVAWLILALGVSPWITAQFVHLGMNPGRLWRFPWIALGVTPFFALDEYVCRRLLQGLSTTRMVMFHLSTRFALVIAVLTGFFVLRNGQFLLVLLLPGLLMTSFLGWSMTTWIHRKTGSALASALFSALATGWFFSVFFAQV